MKTKYLMLVKFITIYTFTDRLESE